MGGSHEWAEGEMAEGYRDGRDPDAPEPSGNRSQSYRHGFQSGRNDLTKTRNAPNDVRRAQAEAAIKEDSQCSMPRLIGSGLR